ncbi:MAG: ATP-binding protein [Nitrospirota bacterium]|nr:ATP-binding protein [Nitrospirota bacterium]
MHPEQPPQAENTRRIPQALKVAVGALLALMLITLLVLSQVRGEGRGNLWVLTLVNMNLILAVVVALLLSRNLVKWFFEGQRLNSLRTRLVAAFVGFTLIPAVLLFLVASEMITNSVDGWFAPQVEQAMSEAAQVARDRYREMRLKAASDARRVASTLPGDWLLEHPEAAAAWLEERRLLWGFSGLAVRSGPNGEQHVTAGVVDLSGTGPPAEATRALPTAEGELLQAVVAVGEWGWLVAERLIPQREIKRLSTITDDYENFAQLAAFKDPIKEGYRLSFLVITLLILFSATWFGFYIARGITNPLQQLVEGTREVAAGNLAVQVPRVTRDEVGELVSAFNAMTSELGRTNRRLTTTNRELESRRAYMEAILENAATGVIALDAAGKVSLFNRAAAEILGLDPEQVRGRPYREAFGPMTPQVMAQMSDLLREPGAQLPERQVTIAREAGPVTLQVNARRLSRPEGGSLGMVLVFDDLTELIRVQKDAAWREVAQRLAHEIKNPLTPIQLSVQRVQKWFEREGVEPPPVVRETTDTILGEVAALKNLVDEFSQFARMPRPQPAPTDIWALVGEVASLYRQAYPAVKLEVEPADLGPMELDGEQMRRVFTNLFENAVQAMGGEGRIRVSGEVVSDDWVAVRVADTGPGIPRDDQDKVFQPYFSRRQGGTGLGLAITFRIVEEHGGFIRLADNPDGGACFVVSLPRGVTV